MPARLLRFVLPCLLAAWLPSCASSDESTDADETSGALNYPFPDTAETLPLDWALWSRYKFKLSQSYPSVPPAASSRPWLAYDFAQDPDGYILALRNYLYEGFIHGADPDADFRPEMNFARRWYHVPWMHGGPRGRESIHGLTRERDADPQRLAPTQTTALQDWGIGFYNDVGGYTVGRVWRDHDHPDPTAARFGEGTVVFKMLFSTADVATSVPWLATAPAWTANVYTSLTGSKKALSKVHLVQLDVAVKDQRSPRGWVYATLVYDANAPSHPTFGAYGRMVPAGLAWGNDPTVALGGILSETRIAQSIPAYARATLGYGGRLNGPADNPVSACVSCHSTAEFPSTAAMTPVWNAGPVARMKWFRNLPPGEPFEQGNQALDTSLQLQISLESFAQANP
jgi:hypothetical protein